MCSNMLGTILWQRKHGRPHNFFQVRTSLNNFKHERKKAPLPMKEMAPKKREKASHIKKKTPVRGEKLHKFFWIFNGGGRAPRDSCTCPPLVTYERK